MIYLKIIEPARSVTKKNTLNNVLIFLGQQCLTTDESPDSNVPCALPFKWNGELRNSCITDLDPDGKYWCSTKVSPRTKEHIGGEGNWGWCRNSCPPINSTETTASSKTTEHTT